MKRRYLASMHNTTDYKKEHQKPSYLFSPVLDAEKIITDNHK